METCRLNRSVLAMLVVVALSGCLGPGHEPVVVKPGIGMEPGHVVKRRISKKSYIPYFSDQGRHLETLIEDGNWPDATDLYIEQQKFFAREVSKYWYADALAALVAHLKDQHEAPVVQALTYLQENTWPQPRSRWKDFRDHFGRADRALAAYDAHPLLQLPENRSPEANALSALVTDLRHRLSENLAEAFAHDDFHADGDFFEIYPLSTTARTLIREARPALKRRFSVSRSSTIQAFAKRYPIGLTGASLWRDLGRWLTDAKARELAKNAVDPASTLGRLEIALAAAQVGLDVPQRDRLHFGFVDATSRALLQARQIDFSPNIWMDLPVVWHKGPIDDFIGRIPRQKVDFIIALDVVIATARRRVKNLSDIKSQYVFDHETLDNPAYEVARIELVDALAQAKGPTSGNPLTMANPLVLMSSASHLIKSKVVNVRVAQAKRVFFATPRTIKVPKTKPYSYERAQVEASKSLSANAYVIDLQRGLMYNGDFEAFERMPFRIAYRVEPEDPRRADILASHHQERDVSRWESRPIRVKLSSLMSDYLNNRATEEHPINDFAALFADLRAKQTKAFLAYRADVHDDRPLNDPRFDSVVTLYHGDGGMAAGFYVAPNMVLTSWHVVKERDYVEMGRHDGQITYGRVLARDPSLDLALVKVQDRGRPLRLYEGPELTPGLGIDVIGHPHREQFSITRGIIGKVKKMTMTPAAGRAYGDKVYFIQSDAATNPGNSGGPVFVGERVIGIHSQGVSKDVGEGLGYAVHYSHIRNFLKDQLAAPLPISMGGQE